MTGNELESRPNPTRRMTRPDEVIADETGRKVLFYEGETIEAAHLAQLMPGRTRPSTSISPQEQYKLGTSETDKRTGASKSHKADNGLEDTSGEQVSEKKFLRGAGKFALKYGVPGIAASLAIHAGTMKVFADDLSFTESIKEDYTVENILDVPQVAVNGSKFIIGIVR